MIRNHPARRNAPCRQGLTSREHETPPYRQTRETRSLCRRCRIRSCQATGCGTCYEEVADVFTMYADYAIDLVVDISAILLLAYVLYFRRHRRADLLLAYVTLNIGIFVAVSLLGTAKVDVALGFGLFAILSIIRLRSSAVTQQEVAYYFVALVLGLVNGLDLDDRRFVMLINALLLVTMAVVDSRPVRDRARRLDVTLDVVHSDEARA